MYLDGGKRGELKHLSTLWRRLTLIKVCYYYIGFPTPFSKHSNLRTGFPQGELLLGQELFN